ncbi:MAG: cache domain-containing protein [Spirochaetaceae bacterium]|nr:cache domain-containing protein [Spirochaetaceae bacterium]
MEESIINQKKKYLQSVIFQSITKIDTLTEVMSESYLSTAELLSENIAQVIISNERESVTSILSDKLQSLSLDFPMGSFQYVIFYDKEILYSLESNKPSIIDESNSAKIKSILEYKDYKIIVYISNEDFTNEIQQDAADWIRKISLPDDEYIWINQIINFEGGDDYAIRLVHPNLPDTEGMFLSTSIEDIKGNKPYLEELNGINEKGEVFFEYYFKKMNSDKISHKLTYAKLYKEFNWVIATGVYLDDIAMIVSNDKELIQKELNREILVLALFILIILSFAVLGLISFEKKISNLLLLKNQELEKTNRTLSETMEQYKSVNSELQNSLDEIRTLNGLLPICAHCKKIKDEKGYWNQIESYIESHTDALFSHGLCESCAQELYGDKKWYKKNKKSQ